MNNGMLGPNIKYLSRLKGMDLTDLSNYSKITRPTIYSIANGSYNSTPSPETIESIAKVFEVTPERLTSYDFSKDLQLDDENVGKNIFNFCLKQGLCLNKLSEMSGVHATTIYNAVKRNTPIGNHSLNYIAIALNVSILSLFQPASKIEVNFGKVAKNVKEFCNNKNITLQQFSRKAKIRVQTLYNLTNHEYPLSNTNLLKIVNFIGISIEELSA